ncbi:NAD-dependent epimerase/dehydratase family protein [Candidatus Daviesbacteria bacterium]|nr:NAD-dependent epimerase/dehydratase family protein [Candidatus Daviesbacteria bacterium]
MKKIAVIGGNGMLGSDLVKYLSSTYSVTSITKDNYAQNTQKEFDIVINANGNSRRYWANQNPRDDFFSSTVSVINSIFDFPSKFFIYVSSSDVYENHTAKKYTKEGDSTVSTNLSPYGFHKHLAEVIVKKYKEKFLILRCSMILGSNLRKGPIYDIIQNQPLYITLSSRLQLITTQAIAQIIKTLLKKSVVNQTLNIGGDGSFHFARIQKFLKKKIRISADAETQTYEMSVRKIKKLYPKLKTSEEYLQEFLKLLCKNA